MKYDELARKLRDRIDKGIGERVHDVIERVRISSPSCSSTTCNARLIPFFFYYFKLFIIIISVLVLFWSLVWEPNKGLEMKL